VKNSRGARKLAGTPHINQKLIIIIIKALLLGMHSYKSDLADDLNYKLSQFILI